MGSLNLHQLISDVQFNCDVADAQYAGNYTMCTYLLRMRELYRWSSTINQSDTLPQMEVSRWVEEKESGWASLENARLKDVHIGTQTFDPFAVDQINEALAGDGLVYGAGYGQGCRPQFYLGALDSYEGFPTYDVVISGMEYARDLASPVAMSQGRRIYVRRESVRRMLWEQIEAWRWRKSPPDDPLARVLAGYPFDEAPEDTLDKLVELQIEYAVNHEVGERVAADLLGDAWLELLEQHAGGRVEWVARAVKDHLSDALVTLPEICRNDAHDTMHLYFANLTSLRKKLFPQLIQAYHQWLQPGDYSFNVFIARSRQHWLQVARTMLDTDKATIEKIAGDDGLEGLQPAFSVIH